MNLPKIKQSPVSLGDEGKRGMRTQFGALCWREKQGKVQILLVTSRRRGRWIIPKGWPLDGETPAKAAETEAWEEAGVEGKAKGQCLGVFGYDKEHSEGEQLPCMVALFPLKVKRLSNDWPEKDERRRKWMSPKKAANLVDEPDLAAILKAFDPLKL